MGFKGPPTTIAHRYFAVEKFLVPYSKCTNASAGLAGLGWMADVLGNRLVTVTSCAVFHELFVKLLLLFVDVVDFFPVEAGIPMLARAVRFVPLFCLRCHLTND